MVVGTKRYTVEAFDAFIEQPENREKLFEYIGGRIVEVVSNNYASKIAMTIGAFITLFVKEHGLGDVTGADGGYKVAGERYIPDVGFISREKQPEPSHEAYNPNPPDLAVEVLSPTNAPADIRIKVVNYLQAGTTVWVVDPDAQSIEVYAPGQSPRTLVKDETLDGGDVLPGFELTLKDIFAA